ncbi:class I SAM-dependent methyltransferase [Acinetobacter sp. WCHAc060042]|uniref:class I SAM-dependent methyltransferase n=1 Tax=Acinetobacter sp. WCHAc060042 TaxID=2213016 RepID=UPI000DA6A86C|nr:class I SAM-dependent methyltransferase [Acinetobacter sp. WCHAc060042]
MNKIIDIPSPINLQDPLEATQWAKEANIKRPYRLEFFKHYISQILSHPKPDVRILELGSGPGFLAYELLDRRPNINYTAVDFSVAMHSLAKQRLATIAYTSVDFIIADFKQQDWYTALLNQRFDYVVIHQALHELRHKAYTNVFHKSIAQHVIQPNGTYFITDHLAEPDGQMGNRELYMNKHEHIESLKNSGFGNVEIALEIDGLCAFQVTL